MILIGIERWMDSPTMEKVDVSAGFRRRLGLEWFGEEVVVVQRRLKEPSVDGEGLGPGLPMASLAR